MLNTGAGIRAAQEAGAQLGKCFSISMNEYGGANDKATPTYSFRPTSGTNEAMRLPVFGGILLDSEGNRFVNEGMMCEKTMFCCEPLVRESYHYAAVRRGIHEALGKRAACPNVFGRCPHAGHVRRRVLPPTSANSSTSAVDEGWACEGRLRWRNWQKRFDLPGLESSIGDGVQRVLQGRT